VLAALACFISIWHVLLGRSKQHHLKSTVCDPTLELYYLMAVLMSLVCHIWRFTSFHTGSHLSIAEFHLYVDCLWLTYINVGVSAVTMQAQREAPPDMQCKDKFLVQSVIAPPGTLAKDVTQDLVCSSVWNWCLHWSEWLYWRSNTFIKQICELEHHKRCITFILISSWPHFLLPSPNVKPVDVIVFCGMSAVQ